MTQELQSEAIEPANQISVTKAVQRIWIPEHWRWPGWEWIFMLLNAGEPPDGGKPPPRKRRSKPPPVEQLELPFPKRPIRLLKK
jgi:hypothetical protein